MKYRTKLYLAFGGIVLGTALLFEGVTYFIIKQKVIEMIRGRVLGIATNAAISLKKTDIEAIKNQMDDKTEEFAAVLKQLRAIRDENRNNILFVQDIYLLEPDPKYPEQIIILADASDGNNYAPPGTPYPEGVRIGILNHLNEPFSPTSIATDRWGKFFPGYAPIFNSNGEYVATVGINITVAFVNRDLNWLKLISLTSMGITLVAGLTIATILANIITRSLKRIQLEVAKIGEENSPIEVETFGNDEFGDLARQIYTIGFQRQNRDSLKLHFLRNVSKPIMEKILKKGKMPFANGEKRKLTILCSDIRQFNNLTETLSPEQVVSLLNEYLSAMFDVIFAHNGTVDKVIGDELVIEFGAPLEDTAQETHAVETAVEMQEALRKLNLKWDSQGRPQISMVIGIHTDQGIVANIGSEMRKDYTTIGNAITSALRIKDAAKRLEVPILISETTWVPARNRYESKDLGPLYLKGKTKAVKIYSIEIPKD